MLRRKRYLGVLVALAAAFALVGAVACGGDTEVVEVIKEVEVVKEVVKEVPVEVIKEVEVVKEVEVEMIVEVEKVVVVKEEVVKEVEVVVEKEVVVSSFVETTAGIPHTIRGPAAITALPKTFNEAPMLAALVATGDLPPVAERLPEQPLMIKPANEIGQYGGTWRGEGQFPTPPIFNAQPTFFDETGSFAIPWVFRGWEFSNDNKTVTFFMRKGMRWSDGVPFTADDVMFWYEDVFLNEELTVTKAAAFRVGLSDKEGVWEKVDDYTVKVTFEKPYELFPSVVGTSGAGGIWVTGTWNAMYLPRHYLKDFHPKYAEGGQAAVDAMAEAAGFDTWTTFFHFTGTPWRGDIDANMPVLNAWIVVSSGAEGSEWVRNPYYFAVDTAGNQLPYIDRLSVVRAADAEVRALRMMAGEYDLHQIDGVARLPLMLQNQEKGDYEVYLWTGLRGSDAAIYINQTNDAGDAEIQKWLANRDFRIALSIAINREEINQIIWSGLGEPASIMPSGGPFSAGREWEKKHVEFDPITANALLDDLGLHNRDADGFRLRTDNGERLVINLNHPGGTFFGLSLGDLAENLVSQWETNLGLKVDGPVIATSALWSLLGANEGQLVLWANDTGADNLVPWQVLPATWGPRWNLYYDTGGKSGIAPPAGSDAEFAYAAWEIAKGSISEGIPAITQALKNIVDNVYMMGLIGNSPAFQGMYVVSNRLGNVPREYEFIQTTIELPPRNALSMQWYIKQ